MNDYELKKILEGSFNVYKDAILDVAVRSIKEHEYKTSQKTPYVLDKIREEVEGLKACVALDEEGEFWYRDALNDAIEIIDKYIDRGMRGVI